MPIFPGPPALWWSVRLVNYATRLGLNPGTTDVFNPPPGYDPYTGLVDGSNGPFVTEGGDVLYTGALELRRVTMQFLRANEDVASIGFSVLKLVSGSPSSAWASGDYDNVEGALAGLWAAIKPHYGDATHDEPTTLDRIQWHKIGSGVSRPQPSLRETVLNTPGTATTGSALPPQVACSVTMKTSRRRSWGRVYLPAPLVADIAVNGRFGSTFVGDMRTAAGNLADALKGFNVPLVVWCPRLSGALLQSVTGGDGKKHLQVPDTSSFALTVDQIQVDDLPDVIRRRRFDRATIKQTHTV